MGSIQDKMAAEASGDGFEVRTADGGPETVVAAATRALLGRAERAREDQAEDSAQKALLQRGKRCARLFRFSHQKDADAYADLMSRHSRGEILFIEYKDLTSGTDMSRFLDWVEFDKALETVRAEVGELSEKFMSGLRANRKALNAAAVAAAAAVEPKKKPRQRKPRTPAVVDLEPMPASFRGVPEKGAGK